MEKDTTEDQIIESEELEQEEVEENTEGESPIEEEAGEVEEQEEEGEPEEPAEEPEQTEERPPSRRESLRIQQLINKMKQESSPEPQVKPGLDYNEALDAEPEVIQQLEQDRQSYAQATYQEVLERQKADNFKLRLEFEAPKVEEKYPTINPRSEQFNPAVADALNSMYLSAVGYNEKTGSVRNPDVRYTEYIESMMELADEVATEKTVKSAKNIAKQVASTGLRPDGSRAKKLNLDKQPHEMSNEELEAKLKQFGL